MEKDRECVGGNRRRVIDQVESNGHCSRWGTDGGEGILIRGRGNDGGREY